MSEHGGRPSVFPPLSFNYSFVRRCPAFPFLCEISREHVYSRWRGTGVIKVSLFDNERVILPANFLSSVISKQSRPISLRSVSFKRRADLIQLASETARLLVPSTDLSTLFLIESTDPRFRCWMHSIRLIFRPGKYQTADCSRTLARSCFLTRPVH